MRNAVSGPCLIVLALALCHLDQALAILELPIDSKGAIVDASCNNCDAARLQSGQQLRHQRPENPKVPDALESLSYSTTDNTDADGSFYEDNDIHRQLLNDEEKPNADLKRSQHLMKSLRFQGLGKRTAQQKNDIGNAHQNRMNRSRQRRHLSPIYLLDENELERETRNVLHPVLNSQQKPRISAGMRYTGIGKRRGVYRNTRNFGYRHRYYGLGKR